MVRLLFRWLFGGLTGLFFLLLAGGVRAQEPFHFPTANHALFEPGGELKFFVPTAPGKGWISGCFGCVRDDGWRIHEGLDIRCLQRNKHGEPTDPVMATADGTVAYINFRPWLSNYGKYIVLRHHIDGVEIYSLYAHLSKIEHGLRPGRVVKVGETIGIMGRTTDTHEGISKARAHVHFELDLLVNDRFASWFKRAYPGERNDHGEWNGFNLTGLDPRLILLDEHKEGAKFNLLHFIRNQTALFRVMVRKTHFPWLERYPELVRSNPVAKREGVAGYEIAFNYNGVAFELIPRAASEIKGKGRYQLLSVNEAEYRNHHCRRFVVKKRGHWQITSVGIKWLDELTW